VAVVGGSSLLIAARSVLLFVNADNGRMMHWGTAG